MAGRPKKSDTKSVIKKDDKLIKENDKLKQEVDELKDMVKQLIEQSKIKDDEIKEKTTIIEESDVIISIEPREMIKVTSLYHGGLNLTGLNNKHIRFDRFGHTKAVYFEDVESICTLNRTLLEKGFFFIHDERIPKILYMEDVFEKIIKFDILKNIFQLNAIEIEKLYLSTTKELQKTIIHTFANWINENDPFYIDKNKIETINRISGQDVLKIAETLKTYEV